MDREIHTTCRQGFTLIELLVVIAIIGILAGIMFPVYSVARESGRRAACEHSLHQLGMMVQMYSDDWKGNLPPFTSKAMGDTFALRTAFQNYGRGVQLWRCPSDRGFDYEDGTKIKPSFYKVYGSSYLFNGYIYGGAAPKYAPKVLSACKDPVNLILFWDWVSHPYDGAWWQQAVFGDGHVRHLSNQALYHGVAVQTASLW